MNCVTNFLSLFRLLEIDVVLQEFDRQKLQYMFRIIAPILYITLFIGWTLYRLIIKKDLKQNLDNFYLGLFFIAVWALIFFFMLR